MDPTVLKPTPHYNMAVMEDVMMVPLNDCLVSGIVLCPILRDVIVAAKVRKFLCILPAFNSTALGLAL